MRQVIRLQGKKYYSTWRNAAPGLSSVLILTQWTTSGREQWQGNGCLSKLMAINRDFLTKKSATKARRRAKATATRRKGKK
jgi:hypothetical protein